MTWQDLVIGIGDYIFVVALLPSVFSKDKPALSSSLLTGAILAIFGYTFITLGLWNSAIGSFCIAITWFILAVQKYKIDRQK